MKKIIYIFIISLYVMCVSGCGMKESKINSDSKLALAKKQMIENLDNYSYDVKITTTNGLFDINMQCREDIKNQISYCATSTYGVDTEEYIDNKSNTLYSKVTVPFGGDSSNGQWNSSKYNQNSNAWLSLNDYIYNITEESYNGGIYYTGTIDSKKIATAMSQINSDSNTSSIVNGDIKISVFINSLNYIEKMSFTLEIMGIEELVEINYKEFNTSGDIVIPSDAM